MPFLPYRFFSGNCREAFTFYHEVFGGQLDLMSFADSPGGDQQPPELADQVMHVALHFGDNMLMGSDDPTGDGADAKGLAIHYTADDAEDADRIFDALAEGGEVQMPMEETFWAPRFGACVDRFGTSWMISVDPPADATT